MNKVKKFFDWKIKAVDEGNHIVTTAVSTIEKDRDGDVIPPEAFNTDNYLKHPVLLSSHQYSGLINQIGKCINITKTATELVATFKYFVGKGNPEADWAFQLCKEGIAAWSVGFMGNKFEYIEEAVDGYNQITGRKYSDVELLEVSQVLVPANAGAVLSIGENRELAIKALGKEVVEKIEKGEAPAKKEEAPAEETCPKCKCKFAVTSEGVKSCSCKTDDAQPQGVQTPEDRAETNEMLAMKSLITAIDQKCVAMQQTIDTLTGRIVVLESWIANHSPQGDTIIPDTGEQKPNDDEPKSISNAVGSYIENLLGNEPKAKRRQEQKIDDGILSNVVRDALKKEDAQ
jgi:hypothetical protein